MTVGGSCLGYWGAPPGSSIHGDALAFLRLRAIGCPTTLILLVCQVMLQAALCQSPG